VSATGGSYVSAAPTLRMGDDVSREALDLGGGPRAPHARMLLVSGASLQIYTLLRQGWTPEGPPYPSGEECCIVFPDVGAAIAPDGSVLVAHTLDAAREPPSPVRDPRVRLLRFAGGAWSTLAALVSRATEE
jgi:hypothetical protein